MKRKMGFGVFSDLWASRIVVFTMGNAWHLCLMAGLTLAAGCSIRSSAIDIIDYRGPGEAKRYHETFDEAYYDVDKEGNVHIVLRRETSGNGQQGRPITQVVHIRSLWRSIPGRTVAHRTQINSTLTYCMTSGYETAMFEGAGSVFFTRSDRTDTLTGRLDLARLRPVHTRTAQRTLFRGAELSGEFQ